MLPWTERKAQLAVEQWGVASSLGSLEGEVNVGARGGWDERVAPNYLEELEKLSENAAHAPHVDGLAVVAGAKDDLGCAIPAQNVTKNKRGNALDVLPRDNVSCHLLVHQLASGAFKAHAEQRSKKKQDDANEACIVAR